MATLKNLIINDTGNIKLPVGTTAQRSAVAGTIRYNSTLSLFEGYDGTVWTPLNTFQPNATTIYTATPPGGVWPVPVGTRFVNALVVAGGGGGGLCMGGGGGGGGVRYMTNIPVTPGGTVTVAVGAGGAGANSGRGVRGGNGGNSVFGSFTATGGGGGATWGGGGGTAAAGGSGGGGTQPSSTGGAGNTPVVTPPQGNPGGNAGGFFLNYAAGGGGGGAGSRGRDGNPFSAGFGGAAVQYSEIGGSVGRGMYGGGGGGGLQNGSSRWGIGADEVGGTGTNGPATGGAGIANSGSGGGGGGHPPDGPGGAGGSGVVIIQTITNQPV